MSFLEQIFEKIVEEPRNEPESSSVASTRVEPEMTGTDTARQPTPPSKNGSDISYFGWRGLRWLSMLGRRRVVNEGFSPITRLIIVLTPFILYAGYYTYGEVKAGTTRIATTLDTSDTLAQGLVGHWTFDGADFTDRVYDQSSQSNHGYLVGIATSSTKSAGKIGQGLKLDGSGYVQLPPTAFGSSLPYSISVWFRPRINPPNNSHTAIFYGGDGNAYSRIDWGQNFGTSPVVKFAHRRQSDLQDSLSSTLQLNTWHHAVLTFEGGDGTLVRSYINGVLVEEVPAYSGTISSPEVYIGIESFDGLIDDVRVYNRTLSSTEVRKLHELGVGTKINVTATSSNPMFTLHDGLFGHWTFNGEHLNGDAVSDASGKGNDGLLIYSPSRVSGVIGQGLEFNGSDQRVNIGSGTFGVPSGSSSITLAAWVKPHSYSNFRGIISKVNATPPFGGWQLNTNGSIGNRFDFALNISGTWYTNITNGTPVPTTNTNEWYHVAGTYDGSAMRLFIDGELVSTAQISGTVEYQNSASPVYIGMNGSGAGTPYFDGLIDDTRIYNRALSVAEVQQLYEEGSGFTVNNTITPTMLEQGLVGHWTFDGGDVDWSSTTAEALDVSGNANHGNVVNFGSSQVGIGVSGQALSLDGSNDYIESTSVPFNFGTGNFTYSVWAKRSGTGISNLMGKWDSPSGPYMQFDVNDKLRMEVFAGSRVYFLSTNAITDTDWHHYVCMRTSGTNIDCYMDGAIMAGTDSFSGTPNADTSTNLIVGGISTNTGAEKPFKGTIDDARVYNRALTSGEVTDLYNIGRRGE
jgi:hypothetical protein